MSAQSLVPANLLLVNLYRYRKAVNAYASHQSASFEAAFHGDAAALQVELARIESERLEILQLLSPDHHVKLVEKGLKRLSFNATIAALMIHLYVCSSLLNYLTFFCTLPSASSRLQLPASCVSSCCITFMEQVRG